jgi:hypothetical protein
MLDRTRVALACALVRLAARLVGCLPIGQTGTPPRKAGRPAARIDFIRSAYGYRLEISGADPGARRLAKEVAVSAGGTGATALVVGNKTRVTH